MHTFSLVFLAALALATATKLWLAMRHLAHIQRHRNTVPAEFSSDISVDAHHKAADYSCAKTRLGLFTTVFECALILVLTFGGGLQWLQEVTAGWLAPGVARGVALLVLLGTITSLLDLPVAWYSTFSIEQRFGFNKMTPLMFIADILKNAALAAALGIPLIACILWVMERAGDLWWLYAWLIWVTFTLLIQAVYPVWIAPLFNKFAPLDDAQLKQRIDDLLHRCGFKLQGIMVMDGSRRSSHTNAFFTGFGKTKRIVFFDTLLAKITPPEIEAVLAHELGHFKLRHVIKRIVWIFAASLAFLWLLAQLINQPWFYNGLNVQTPSTAMALVLFFLVLPQFIFLLHPLTSFYSRKHEFEADHYAARHASVADLISALVKLYKDNSATLTPDPLHSMFYDSHPPATLRIARLQAYKPA
ncbi:MAG: M48 family metallopeptidase [Proteobacteria bacterium]|nr:M48 family metallopeptidase [Pseudomonadota bacterium]